VAQDDHAIVIGINKYPYLGDLDGSEGDAQDFYDWLCSGQGGDIPPGNVDKIISSLYQNNGIPEPTTVQIDFAFEKLCILGEKTGRAGRRLYIYMAGHGLAMDLEETALLVANAAQGRTSHHIPGRAYANWFRIAAFFDEVVLFMDCCRESYPRAPSHPPPCDPTRGRNPARHYFGFATSWSRAAREGPDPNGKKRGLFTLALLAGLRGGACDPSGQITSASLESFIFNYIPRLETNGNNEERQEPVFDYDKNKQISFRSGVPSPFKLRVSLTQQNTGAAVELDGPLKPAPVTVGPPTWEWNLIAGMYTVRIPGGPQTVVELIGEGGVRDVQI
jgi:hypothetical protein